LTQTHNRSDISASFSRWAQYRARTRKRFRNLTGRDAESFFEYFKAEGDPDDDLTKAIPDQVPAPVRLKIVGDVLDTDDPATETRLHSAERDALLAEMMELCADVRASSYLSNTAPGVDRKLTRLSTLLSDAGTNGFSAPTVVRIGVLSNSLKDVTRSSEELAQSSRSELLSLFVQLDLFLVQFEEWRAYVRHGAEQEWGRRVSQEYVAAIANVLITTSQRHDVVSDTVSERLVDAAEGLTLVPEPESAIAGATATSQNLLAAIFGRIRAVAGDLFKAVKTEAIKRGASLLLDKFAQLVISLSDSLIRLAHERPIIFGWVEQLVRRVLDHMTS
jgi:hypothetical protein